MQKQGTGCWYTYRKEGKSIREIGKVLGWAYYTVRDWLIYADPAGLDRLYDIPKLGLPHRLFSKQPQFSRNPS